MTKATGSSELAAAQPEREAVLVTEAMIDAALKARVPGGAEVWVWLPQEDAWTPHQTARDVMRCALEAALTTLAPARSRRSSTNDTD